VQDRELRLDQLAGLADLVGAAERGAIAPAEGLREIARLREAPPRRDTLTTVLGYATMAVGVGLILQPTPGDLVACALLGTLVGALRVWSRLTTIQALVPLLASFAVAALVFLAAKQGAPGVTLRTVIPPLATFLPGGALAVGTVELACGDRVSGTSRLATGVIQLLLLVLGMLAAAELVGLPPSAAFRDAPANLLGAWAPWLGVLVFGLGTALHHSAPPRSLPAILGVLCAAWIGQLLGNRLFGGYAGGFVGGLAMTLAAYAVQHRFGGPPAVVTLLPGTWLLVPAALGLIGLAEMAGEHTPAGLASFWATSYTIVAVALGVLAGTAVARGLEERDGGGASPLEGAEAGRG